MSELGSLRNRVAQLEAQLAALRRLIDHQLILPPSGNGARLQVVNFELLEDIDAGSGETASIRLYDFDGDDYALLEDDDKAELEIRNFLRSLSGLEGDRGYAIKRPWGFEPLILECRRDDEES